MHSCTMRSLSGWLRSAACQHHNVLCTVYHNVLCTMYLNVLYYVLSLTRYSSGCSACQWESSLDCDSLCTKGKFFTKGKMRIIECAPVCTSSSFTSSMMHQSSSYQRAEQWELIRAPKGRPRSYICFCPGSSPPASLQCISSWWCFTLHCFTIHCCGLNWKSDEV